jgi:SAM-dependent methyltransferase
MPLQLTAIEWALERLKLLPAPLLDTPLAPGIGRVLASACELNVFETLDKGPLTLEELATCLGCHPQNLHSLLQLLVVAGYVRVRRGRYQNRLVVRRWLLRRSPLNIAPYIIHSPDIVAIWEHLTDAVRTNRPTVHMPYEDDHERPEVRAALERHYAGLAALAMVLGRELVLRAPVPAGATRLLDIGGSHGAYSSLFCRKYRQVRSTIIDLPPGVEAGKRLTPQLGASERIDFLCLDFLKEEWPTDLDGQFDTALYFHIAHLLSPDANEMLLARVAACLKPGGMLVYVDQVTDQKYVPHLAIAMVQLMSLTMSSIGGTCYPFATVQNWLEHAGLNQIRYRHLWTPGATMITACKPS